MKIDLIANEDKKGIDWEDVESGNFFAGVCRDGTRRLYYKLTCGKYIQIAFFDGERYGECDPRNYPNSDEFDYIEKQFSVDEWIY